MTDCSFAPCNRPAYSRDLCTGHYQQQARGAELKPLLQRRPRGRVGDRDALGRKQCWACKEWFPEADYPRWSKSSDGLSTRCRDCSKDYDLQWQYGITLAGFNQLLADQGGCAVCGRDEPDGAGWHVDHDHSCCPGDKRTCGKCVRGVLCGLCNKGLGHFEDDPSRLEAGAKYLRSWNEMQRNTNDQEA